MMRPAAVVTVIVAVLTTLLSGCAPGGRPEVQTAKVSGSVQFNGKPLDGAQVNFLGAEYAGVATTDAGGKYELDAQPGENTVYIVKYVGAGPEFDETMVGSDTPGGTPKQALPKKYSDAESSELRFTVPEDGSTEANFDLGAPGK